MNVIFKFGNYTLQKKLVSTHTCEHKGMTQRKAHFGKTSVLGTNFTGRFACFHTLAHVPKTCKNVWKP